MAWKEIALGAVSLNVAVWVYYFHKKMTKTRRKRAPDLGMVRIYFLRHAQTDNNTRSVARDQGKAVGERHWDPALTELGQKQATGAAHFIRDNLDLLGIKSVYCSPMKKTLLTLQPFVKILGDKVDYKVCIDIFERGGIYNGERSMTEAQRAALEKHHGLNWKEMTDICPTFNFDEIGLDPLRYNDWGAGKDSGWHSGVMETQPRYFERVNRVAEWLYTLKSNTLLVTHGKFLDTLMKCLVLSGYVPEIEDNFLVLHQASGLTCLQLEGDKASFMYVNQPTIPPDLRTGHSMGKAKLTEQDCKAKIRGNSSQL